MQAPRADDVGQECLAGGSEWARESGAREYSTGRRASKARVMVISGACYVLLFLLLFHGSASERAIWSGTGNRGGNQANATIDGKEAEDPKK